MTNAVQDAINQAKQKAAEQAANAQVPATTSQSSAPAPYQAPRKFTADDLAAGSMNVDAFLKVSEDGLKVGDKPGLIDSIIVNIDMSTVQYCEAIKYGNPAVYAKTYDGVKAVGGGTWSEAIARAQAAQPGCQPYNSADLTLILVEAAKSLKGDVIAEPNTKLGHSLSTTNRGNFAELLDKIEAAGLNKHAANVKVKITSEVRTNKKQQKWGVLKFDLLGEVGEDDAVDSAPVADNAAATA